ncbi:uncharacterized protein BDV17DRAFT_74958 [Aspergillus undulatus]|uniref:uncharacterized protein n=1 Tax=Aspergillus undulatus TaxID=1810928 RepID=UPI003CCDF23B
MANLPYFLSSEERVGEVHPREICSSCLGEQSRQMGNKEREGVGEVEDFLRRWKLFAENVKRLRPGSFVLRCFRAARSDQRPISKAVGAAKSHSNVFFDEEDRNEAFRTLRRSKAVYKKHKYAIFIDGLDSFEGDVNGLLTNLRCWVNHNESDVKLCLSSREAAIVTRICDQSELVEMYKITDLDTNRMVRDTLDANRDFEELTHDDPTKRQGFEDEIVKMCGCVFAEAPTVLRRFEKDLLGCRSIEDVADRIQTTSKIHGPPLVPFSRPHTSHTVDAAVSTAATGCSVVVFDRCGRMIISYLSIEVCR